MRTGRKTVRAEGTAGLSGAAEGDGVAAGEEQAKPDAKWRPYPTGPGRPFGD